ncbi:hypothetical protein Hypma_002483 [Hypsizygus marmoreus]|uniref:DUF6589 domain-containing protein n=1 Tax=Hypsizygus marmoreus TaxID=39966 RepID=A0A369J4E2_HYPMA|nr:hypothetical protein Hypma_002483 [Hypsizygus marmoreus]
MSIPNRLSHSFNQSPFPTPTSREPASSSSLAILSGTRIRAARRNKWEKMTDVLSVIQKDFDSLGDFLEHLFHHAARGNDPRSKRHTSMISTFLQGSSATHIGTIIDLIYRHRQSNPPKGSADSEFAYSPTIPLGDIRHARPCLSAWAARVIGNRVYKEVGELTKNDPLDPADRTQLRATRSGRSQSSVLQVTWEDLGKFSIPALAAKYQRRAPLAWYLAESMAAPQKNGKVIVRLRRPHITIAVGAISAFVLARNRFANYLALNIGVWQFACKAHVDEKRILSRFGYAVHDTTVWECLNSLSDSSLKALRNSVAEGVAQGTLTWKFVLDNVQRWDAQREHRLGRQDQLRIGTAATAIKLEDCAPGAFNLEPYLENVMKMERQHLSTTSLFDSIDWFGDYEVRSLHFVRVLVGGPPELESYQKEVSKLFRGEGIAKHRMREGRKTTVQPLGTNAEKEVETQGMMRAILDFEKQMGLDEKALEGKIVMPGGDGASFAAILRIKKYMAAHPGDYKAFRGRVSVPELWHTRATNLNSVAENHYGPIASMDPSALSKSAAAANTKRLSNLKKCDFYPTACSLMLFFEARVLDCWRIYFETDDLFEHIKKLKEEDKIPKLEELRDIARVLVKRYASQEAYEQALSAQESEDATETMKVPKGTPWTAPIQATANSNVDQPSNHVEDCPEEDLEEDAAHQENAHGEPGPTTIPTMGGADRGVDGGADEGMDGGADGGADGGDRGADGKEDESKKKIHVEEKGFDGDRVLANAILFLQDAGWWIEASYAVSEGDIGRVYEIVKIWIFSFTGTSNWNYSNWLLELYCLLRYEASKDMSNGILNNWLVNLTGELGKWIEADLMQEHYNRWLEDMAEKSGRDFDDKFYRHTLSPNVNHFLRIKEEIESAFGVAHRSKAHGSTHLRDEFQSLLRMHKEDQLHCFRSKRSMGHAAVNTFNRGYERLDEGRLKTFLKQSLSYAQVLKDMKSSNSGDSRSDDATSTGHTEESEDNNSHDHTEDADHGDHEEDADDESEQYRPTPDQQIATGTHHAMYIDEESGTMVIDSDGGENDSSSEEEEEEGDIGYASCSGHSDNGE